MSTGHLLASMWSLDPSVIGGCLALVLAYAAWLRGRLTARSLWFLAGVATLVLALVSPIDGLGDHYLFSVHMVQHMLLILIAPPLLLWGLPREPTRRLLEIPWLARLERIFGRPPVTLPTKVLILWAWHLPFLYDTALRNETIHSIEHLSFIVTATMFWWPVLTPLRERRLTPPVAMTYLFGAMAGISLLGIYITFSPTVLYPYYVNPPDPYGALALIRNGWNLSVMADQQLGGVIMALAGGLFYIVAIMVEFGLWFSGPEADVPASAGRQPQTPEPRYDPPQQARRAMPDDGVRDLTEVPSAADGMPTGAADEKLARSTPTSQRATSSSADAKLVAARKAWEGAG